MVAVKRKERALRPYASLGRSSRFKRLVLYRRDLASLHQRWNITPADVPRARLLGRRIGASATAAFRRHLRHEGKRLIPAEREYAQLKRSLAVNNGTRTLHHSYKIDDADDPNEKWVHVAYLTDPLKYLAAVTSASSFVAIGGDKGGIHTTLGVTYLNRRGLIEFSALLTFIGEDNHRHLASIPDLPFDGETSAYHSIWDVLQSLIDGAAPRTADAPRTAFLNGDWMFLSVVLGAGHPSACFPCPLCMAAKNDIIHDAPLRCDHLAGLRGREHEALDDKQQDAVRWSNRFISQTHPPLLSIERQYVVPTPLHLLLGHVNRETDIIKDLVPKPLFDRTYIKVKTSRTKAHGAADVFELNGKEIKKWIDRGCAEDIVRQLPAETPFSTHLTIGLLAVWMKGLYKHLLHKRTWSDDHISSFSTLIHTIQTQWTPLTQQPPFPKLHMLQHAANFAREHKHLGMYSEAQIEAYHAAFRRLYESTHQNSGGKLAERTRRAFAEVVVKRMLDAIEQPF
jgi:hypothetical protein